MYIQCGTVVPTVHMGIVLKLVRRTTRVVYDTNCSRTKPTRRQCSKGGHSQFSYICTIERVQYTILNLVASKQNNHESVAGMSVLIALSHLLPRGSTVAIVFKVVAQILAIYLGVALLIPSFTQSDSGTPQAVRASQTQVTACL